MKPKTLIIVTTALMTLHGVGLFFGAEDAAKMGLPDIGADELNMGQGAYEISSFFNLFLAAVLVQALRLDAAGQRIISKGIAVGYIILLAGIVYHIFTLIPGQAPPAAAGGIFGALTAWSLYVAFGTKDSAFQS